MSTKMKVYSKYENKLRQEIFKKIDAINELYAKIDDMLDDHPELDIEGLTDTYPEVNKIFEKINFLEDEVQFMLVDTKYYPLCGLTQEDVRLLDSPCLHEPEYWPEFSMLEKDSKGHWTTRLIP